MSEIMKSTYHTKSSYNPAKQHRYTYINYKTGDKVNKNSIEGDMKGINPSSGIIIRDTTEADNPCFLYFDNVNNLATYKNSLRKPQLSVYCLPNVPRKICLDVDIDNKNDDIDSEDCETTHSEILEGLKKYMFDFHSITLDDDEIWTWSRHRPDKWSYRIICDYQIASKIEQDFMIEFIRSKMSIGDRDYLDKYGNLMQMPNCWKLGEDGEDWCMEWDKNMNESVFEPDFNDTVMSLIDYSMTLECVAPKTVKYVNEFIAGDKISEINQIIGKSNDIMENFTYGEMNELGFIQLTRVKPSLCPIHNKTHDKIGGYIRYVQESGDVLMGCYRDYGDGKKCIKIANYNVNVRVQAKLGFDTEDAENLKMCDLGYGKIIAKYMKKDILVYDTKKCNAFVWDDETLLWEDVDSNRVLYRISEFLCSCVEYFISKVADPTSKGGKEHIKCLQRIQQSVAKVSTCKNAYTIAMPLLYDIKFPDIVNKSSSELPIRGGKVIDLKTGASRVRTRDDKWSFELDVGMVDNPDYASVDKFINPIFCYDMELVAYMRKHLGVCLTDENVRLMFIWWGDGRNGKSSLTSLLMDILKRCNHGKINISATLSNSIFIKNPKALSGSKSEHTAYLMPLKGLRCGITSELAENELLDDGLIKRITGGDGISVRGLNKDQEEFSCSAKLILPTNHKPTLDASQKALVDRMVYIPFKARFVNPDKSEEKVDEKLHRYKPDDSFKPDKIVNHEMRDTFFTWMVGGAMAYYNDKSTLMPCKAVKDFSNKSLKESDEFARFMAECVVVDGERDKYDGLGVVESRDYRDEWSIMAKDLHGSYDRYVDGSRELMLTVNSFNARLKSMNIKMLRNAKNGNKYIGVKMAVHNDVV